MARANQWDAYVVFFICFTAIANPSFAQEPGPDLILSQTVVKPITQTRPFTSNHCEVVEGCMIADTRRLLRFSIETRNQGTADLVLGPPEENPLFEYVACHGHYHFRDFTVARLLDSNNVPVAAAAKIGFCLEDSYRWDATASSNYLYHCEFQGIQRGWADLYDQRLPCQYIDITGVAAGEYIIELEVDPENRLPEINESNNIVRVPVVLPPPCGAPLGNDAFENATLLVGARPRIFGNSNCATTQPGESPINGALGRSVWFSWTAPATAPVIISTDGTTFNSVLGIYTGDSLQNLATVAEDDDGGFGRNSYVRFTASNGVPYRIKVDGYLGAGGDFILNIIPSTNDHFSGAAPLLGDVGLIRDYNIHTTAEFGEPFHGGYQPVRSLWYYWVAPFTGPVTFDTAGSFLDTVLAVYIGSELNNLARVVSNDNHGLLTTSRLTFQATSNTVYRIAVDGRRGYLGTLLLRWGPPLRLSSPTRGTALTFTVNGALGDEYAFEKSSDLATWTLWKRLLNTNGSLLIHTPITTTNQFHRLYLE